MSMTTMSSRQFNQDVSQAKRAAQSGPVFITDRGRPAHVLLNIHEYEEIIQKKENILDLLAMPGAEEIDFQPQPKNKKFYHPADFS